MKLIKMYYLLLAFSISAFFLLNPNHTQAQCHIDDWTALKALYETTEGENNWNDNNGWQEVTGNAPATNCNLANLFGVTLDSESRVDTINLRANRLIGFIPKELESLSNLKYLSLKSNRIGGGIPPELGNLINLEYLSLAFNNLINNNIPAELGNLANLVHLDLARNELSGTIPPEIGNLEKLEHLSLWDNELSGAIPPELGNLSNLEFLNLNFNQLSGSIPPQLGNLSNLEEMSLVENQLNGSIPPELGNLSNLTELYLQANQLSGSIPPELGNLSNLTYLWLFSNELSGSIPPELGNLNNLTNLSLRDNQLSGSIPPEIGNLSSLVELSMPNNQLSGSIPPEFSNLSNLEELFLSNNQLSGGIPPELAELSNLTILEINDNNLSGCYSTDLNPLCTQIIDFVFTYRPIISGGNNFDATWRDFCDNEAGICRTSVCSNPPKAGVFNCIEYSPLIDPPTEISFSIERVNSNNDYTSEAVQFSLKEKFESWHLNTSDELRRLIRVTTYEIELENGATVEMAFVFWKTEDLNKEDLILEVQDDEESNFGEKGHKWQYKDFDVEFENFYLNNSYFNIEFGGSDYLTNSNVTNVQALNLKKAIVNGEEKVYADFNFEWEAFGAFDPYKEYEGYIVTNGSFKGVLN